jgi:hypothetical protein
VKNRKQPASLVGDLVRKHNRGSVPAEGMLDTPEKVRDYVERMKAATEERLREDERARQESAARARTRRID